MWQTGMCKQQTARLQERGILIEEGQVEEGQSRHIPLLVALTWWWLLEAILACRAHLQSIQILSGATVISAVEGRWSFTTATKSTRVFQYQRDRASAIAEPECALFTLLIYSWLMLGVFPVQVYCRMLTKNGRLQYLVGKGSHISSRKKTRVVS